VTSNDVLLEMKDILKVFPGIVAVDHANMQISRGEVHALVGENAAGKSTMIKILTGAYIRDGGKIIFDGQDVEYRTPQQAQENGISTIYQEINLVPLRSVAENILMGREPTRFGLLDWKKLNTEANQILVQMGIEIDVTKPLADYNIAIQQMVAIARAVSFKSKLVVMDEPTSSLDDHEVHILFETIHRLKAEGVSVIFITHRLDELFVICDRITIMRDGQTIETRDISSITKLELVSKMLGKELGQVRRGGATSFELKEIAPDAEMVLELDQVNNSPTLQDVSLNVRKGEIVGLAGLLGSGRSEAARVIFGADPIREGQMSWDGKPVNFTSTRDAIDVGMGYCPEDRKAEGVVPFLSVRENLTLAVLPRLTQNGIINRDKQKQIVDQFIKLLGIKLSSPDQKIRELSGGNQQKVLLARWLCMNPQLLILDEPTRGIDVGAKGEIQKIISGLADEGVGVLMITSEMEELTEGSHRVFVMRDRRTVTELAREEISQDAIMGAMAHGESENNVEEVQS
jgi:ribose transport system ATP-binding protein